MVIKNIVPMKDFPMLNNMVKTTRKISRLKHNNNDDIIDTTFNKYDEDDEDEDENSDFDSSSNECESPITTATNAILSDNVKLNVSDRVKVKVKASILPSPFNSNIYKFIKSIEEEKLENIHNDTSLKIKPIRVNEIISSKPSTLNDLIGDDDNQLMSSNSYNENNTNMVTMINTGDMNMESAVKVDHFGRIYIVDENNDDVETNVATVVPEDNDDYNYGRFGNKSRQILRDGIETNESINFKRSSVSINSHHIKLPGEEYKSKKSTGDIWKKGMLQPHAYIPLNGKLLGKKKNIHKGLLKHYTSVLTTGRKKKSGNQVAKSSKNKSFGKKIIMLSRKQRVARKLKG